MAQHYRVSLCLLCGLLCHITQSVALDPVHNISIVYPKDGDVTTLPLRFKFDIRLTSADVMATFQSQYRDKMLCVEVKSIGTKCSPIMGARVTIDELLPGNYTAKAYISSAEGAGRYHETSEISFMSVNSSEFQAHIIKMIKDLRVSQDFPEDINILQWTKQQKNIVPIEKPATSATSDSGTLLVIGIKTAVLTNFAHRQAIRETWANRKFIPADIKIVFLGCEPILDEMSNSSDRQRFQAAVDLEKETFGDLLTHELNCQDSRKFLADKVSGFMAWAVANFPHTAFVMITDDDVYTRVQDLAEELRDHIYGVQRERLYLGELPEKLHPSAVSPIRDASDAYYTSTHSYPLSQFPPYAAGPHFLLSVDCVRFIAKNRRRLGSLSGQDDTSTALWLLTLQVHLQHTPAFASLRSNPCRNNLLSLADLSPMGIRAIHNNLFRGHQPCHGFNGFSWGWRLEWTLSEMLASIASTVDE
ncbi:Beta-1,3-galactosyltransferase 4 [Phytophthora boehmeriae]|uniref:Hexosyltransferase n=1 Tax=Phytophthora boehmeriae TaxID=109152 RepID=A0A8T1WN05_9STRA|nr:Beta-1,3-galactosyltransferase 4 [Phytophthora boehmeriae]